MSYARIIGTGLYVPEKVVTNLDLEKVMDTTDEWIRQRTGIVQRHVIAHEGVATSDLAVGASRKALEAAHIRPEELDMIVVATMTPDHLLPSTACLVQAKLGATNAGAFDVMAACSGFIYALSTAHNLVRTGQCKTVLVAGAEIFSNRLDFHDRNTAVLFGDGAGAIVVQATDEEGGILSTHLHADGTQYDVLWVPAGGSAAPPTHERIDSGGLFLRMKGPELFKAAIRLFAEAVTEALEHNGCTIDQIDLFIPHQANARIIEMTAERLGLPMEKVLINIDRYANTTAASIPIAIDEAVRDGKIKTNDLVLLAAFGGGLTWASALIKW
jgi:3-oxoacyl-[acyl-carrier-protein] synthase-3